MTRENYKNYPQDVDHIVPEYHELEVMLQEILNQPGLLNLQQIHLPKLRSVHPKRNIL